MKKKYRNIENQKILSLTLCTLISYQPITSFINTFLNLFVGEGFIYDTLVCYIFLLILILKSVSIIAKNIKKDVLGIIFLFLLAYLATFLFFPQNRNIMFTNILDVMENPLYILFIFSISGYLFMRYIEDYELLMMYMIKSSYIVVYCSLMTFLIMLINFQQPQYMVFSYNMLFQVTFLSIMFIEKRNYFILVTSSLGFFLIIVAGARGPLVCFLASALIYIFFKQQKLRKKILAVSVIFILICIVMFFFNDILMFIKKTCDDLNINSRTITLIMEKEFFNDSGRNNIQANIISSYSLFGSGLYGDRYLSGGDRGAYAHSFFVEMQSQWGYLVGPILIIFVLFLIVRAILSKNNNIKILSIAFLSTGFLKLFFTGSYLNQEPSFWILLALGVNSIKIQKGKYNENIVVMQHDVAQNSNKSFKRNL